MYFSAGCDWNKMLIICCIMIISKCTLVFISLYFNHTICKRETVYISLKVGGCGANQNIQNRKWCSSGSTATIRLENLRGFAVSMVQKYSFYMTAVSICSEDARVPQEQVADSGKDPCRQTD